MIIFVVLTDVAVAYSGLESRFYKESGSFGPASTILFGIYQPFARAFSMGLLFLSAGYFIPCFHFHHPTGVRSALGP